MPFRSDDNPEDKEKAQYIKKPITDKSDLEEIDKISDMLAPDEKVLLVTKQSKIKPGGSFFANNTIFATDRRIIIKDPYILGIKENIVDIPYDIITSLKLEKGLLSSTIRFKASGLVSSTKLGMMDSLIEGEDDQTGVIEAIPKDKAEDLLEIIRSGMHEDKKSAPSKKIEPTELVDQKNEISNKAQEPGSVADELQKLAKLKEDGTITEQEFNQMKEDLLKNNKK